MKEAYKILQTPVVESSFGGLEYLDYVDATGRWVKNGFSWILSDSLAPGEYIGFFVIFNTTSSGKFSNVIVSGNLTANDSVIVNIAQYTIDKIALYKSVFVGDEAVFEIVVHNTGSVALDNVTVVESSFDGLEYLAYVDPSGKWINNGLSWTFGDSLAPGEYAGFYIIFNTTCVGNLTNVIVSGNLTANDTVEVLNKTVPDENKTTPEENTTIHDKPGVNKVNISSATGNPLLLILLILLNLVVLRRRK